MGFSTPVANCRRSLLVPNQAPGAMRLPGPVIRSTAGDHIKKRLIQTRSAIIRAIRANSGSRTKAFIAS